MNLDRIIRFHRLAETRQDLGQSGDRYPLLARKGLCHRPFRRVERLQPFHLLGVARLRARQFLALWEIGLASVESPDHGGDRDEDQGRRSTDPPQAPSVNAAGKEAPYRRDGACCRRLVKVQDKCLDRARDILQHQRAEPLEA